MENLQKTEDKFSVHSEEDLLAIASINDSLMLGAIKYLSTNGFKWINVPTMTKICENADTLHAIDHFDKTAYLAQTGQLYLESKVSLHKKVWTAIQNSRAEQKEDGKHLHQFQLLEFEHEGDLESLLGNIENTVQAMIKLVLENDREHLEQLGRDVKHLESYLKPFNRMTYSQAVQTLWGTPTEVRWGDDLGPAQEQALMDIQGNTPLFITHYPKDIKFFNMRVNDSDQEVVNSADLILPYSGESAGSAERENDHERLKDRFKVSQMYRVLKQRGVSLKEFSDYIKLIEKNPVLHSGCGIGFTRVSQSVLGFNDIRMTTNYPINKESLY